MTTMSILLERPEPKPLQSMNLRWLLFVAVPGKVS
jgi:hypothetical protein